MIWFLQIAHVSTRISHDHSATAFHFFTSNFLLGAVELDAPALEEEASTIIASADPDISLSHSMEYNQIV
jgi:hypothetical protein